MISLLGVPGYAHPTATPASHAPRAMASFPCKILFMHPPYLHALQIARDLRRMILAQLRLYDFAPLT
jgi:hypothetical protein